MTLTGTVTGNNRDAIFEKAVEEARAYYNQQCVKVTLNNETATPIGRLISGEPIRIDYQADYEATPGLHFQGISAPNCDTCGQEAK